jgi:hypothetical protein
MHMHTRICAFVYSSYISQGWNRSSVLKLKLLRLSSRIASKGLGGHVMIDVDKGVSGSQWALSFWHSAVGRSEKASRRRLTVANHCYRRHPSLNRGWITAKELDPVGGAAFISQEPRGQAVDLFLKFQRA